MKWIQQVTDRECRGSGRRAGFFLYKSIHGGAASRHQDIQKSVCVGGGSLYSLDSAELRLVLGNSSRFLPSPLHPSFFFFFSFF